MVCHLHPSPVLAGQSKDELSSFLSGESSLYSPAPAWEVVTCWTVFTPPAVVTTMICCPPAVLMICWPEPAVRICCWPPPGLLITMVCFPPTVAICIPGFI